MRRWDYLLIDLDDTIMDYSLSERLSLKETLSGFGLPDTEEVCDAYHAINEELWGKRVRGEITRAELRHDRFERLLALLGSPLDPDELNRVYTPRLMEHAELIGGAEEMLRRASEQMKIALVTNGVTETQRRRLAISGIEHRFDEIIISEEVGLKKPDPRIVRLALQRLGCGDPARAVLVGDSLSTDMAAAEAAGIDGIWFAPRAEDGDRRVLRARNHSEICSLLGI